MQALLAAAAAAAGGGAPAAVPPKLLEALATRPSSASSGTEGAAEALARATAEIERQQTVRAALQAASQEVEQGMSLAVASLCKIATSSASSADTAQAGVRAELEEHKAMVASLEQKLSAERARAAAAEEREKDLATKLTTLRETFLSLGLQAPILASPTPKPPTSTAAQSVVVDDDDEGDAGQAERAAQAKDEGGVAVSAGGVVHEEAAQGSAVQAGGGAGEEEEEESAPLALPPTKLVPLDTTAEETSAVGAGDSSRQASRPGGLGAGEGAPEPAQEVGGYRLVQVSSSVGVPMGAGEAQLGRDLSSRVPGMDALSMKVHRVHAKLVVPPDASGAFTLTRVGKNSLTVLPKEVAITLGLLKEDGEGGLSLMAGRDVQETVGQAKGDGSALVLGLNEPATVQVGDIIVFVDNAACSFLLQATTAARGTKRERGGGGTSPPAKKAREEG